MSETAYERITNRFSDPDALFTRDEVGWLMAQALRWGHESLADDQNAGWPDTTLVFNAGETIRAIERKRYRDECDAAVRAEVWGMAA
jgi:hypothetical protein